MMPYAANALGYLRGAPGASLPSACMRTCTGPADGRGAQAANTGDHGWRHSARLHAPSPPFALPFSGNVTISPSGLTGPLPSPTLTRSVGEAMAMPRAPVVSAAAILVPRGMSPCLQATVESLSCNRCQMQRLAGRAQQRSARVPNFDKAHRTAGCAPNQAHLDVPCHEVLDGIVQPNPQAAKQDLPVQPCSAAARPTVLSWMAPPKLYTDQVHLTSLPLLLH